MSLDFGEDAAGFRKCCEIAFCHLREMSTTEKEFLPLDFPSKLGNVDSF